MCEAIASMDNRILISFVVVTRDRQNDLRECLKSISEQNYQFFEVLVIDNASSDKTTEIVQRDFSFAKLITLDRNLGCPGGRNIGILNSRGEILFFLDDDCRITVDATDNMIQLFEDDQSLGIVAPQIIEYGQPKDPPGCQNRQQIKRYVPNFIGMAAIKRSVFEVNGLYPMEFLYGAEESDLSLRLLNNNGRILYTPDVKVIHFPSANRNTNWDMQQGLVNSVTVFWKYAPVSRALAASIGKPLKYFSVALRTKSLLGWLKGIGYLPFAIFKTIRTHRHQIGWYPFMLQEYLSQKIITSWDQAKPELFSKSWIRARMKL